MPTTGPAALDERPRRRRVVLLAAPWLVAAALGASAVILRPAPSPPATPTAPAAPASEAASSPDGARVENAPAVPTAGPSRALQPLPPTTHLQVLSHARAALGTAGLASDGGGRPDRWAVEVRVADVTAVTDDLAVATVHALVIELADAGWTGPVARAVAVPLATSPEPRVVGPAWPVPAPRPATAEPATEAVADPDPAVLSPLEQAGWAVDELTAVDLVGGAVLQVTLVGVAPDGGERGHHVVWLLDAPGGPRLLPLGAPDAPDAPNAPNAPQTPHASQEST